MNRPNRNINIIGIFAHFLILLEINLSLILNYFQPGHLSLNYLRQSSSLGKFVCGQVFGHNKRMISDAAFLW